jgi:hypothetical protein
MPLAFVGGLVVFLIITGAGRASYGVSTAASSRYLYVYAAFLLLPLAMAADALAHRSRMVGAIVLAVLALGIPGNLRATRRNFPPVSYYIGFEQMMRSLPRMRLAFAVPPTLHPEPHVAAPVTIGWLIGAARSGHLPAPRPSTPREVLTNRLRLSLEQRNGARPKSCPPLRAPIVVRLKRGQLLTVHETIAVQLVSSTPIAASQPLDFGASPLAGLGDHALVAVTGPLTLRIRPLSSAASAC